MPLWMNFFFSLQILDMCQKSDIDPFPVFTIFWFRRSSFLAVVSFRNASASCCFCLMILRNDLVFNCLSGDSLMASQSGILTRGNFISCFVHLWILSVSKYFFAVGTCYHCSNYNPLNKYFLMICTRSF